MAAMSTYLANKLLDHVLRGTVYTPPTNVYVALHEVDPTAAGSGAEITGGSYARQVSTWDVAASEITQNTAGLIFPSMPASAGVAYASIWDASSGGNMLIFGPLDASVPVTAGDAFLFAAADLVATLT
jgi:hypothetical protein